MRGREERLAKAACIRNLTDGVISGGIGLGALSALPSGEKDLDRLKEIDGCGPAAVKKTCAKWKP